MFQGGDMNEMSDNAPAGPAGMMPPTERRGEPSSAAARLHAAMGPCQAMLALLHQVAQAVSVAPCSRFIACPPDCLIGLGGA